MTTTVSQRLHAAFDAIARTDNPQHRIFTRVYQDTAREEAAAADARRRAGLSLGLLDGQLISIKDLFDVAGEPTTAGSSLLRDAAPAVRDAAAVRRLRASGAVIVGKTNMTEFAFSGVGVNPHYGTPGNALDATRIPGGSSSGAGVSVARGLVDIAIGSDTGGSVRIPSALNGVVGFKPSQSRVSREGAFPLSYSLDTVGPLCRSVREAAAADSVLAGIEDLPLHERSIRGLRLHVPRGLLFTQLQDDVRLAVEHALHELSVAGALVCDQNLDDLLGEPFRLQQHGTLVAAEAAWIHRDYLQSHPQAYDPLVISRIRRGQSMDAASYVGLQQARQALWPQLDTRLVDADALVLPTVPMSAPRIADVQSEDDFMHVNALLLRNPSVFNFFDLPALSLPLPRQPGHLPVGLMVVGRRMRDRELLAVGAAVERLFAQN